LASILIIDDEDKYLELCRRHMPEHEFLPPARNYGEARAILDARGDEIDLILLDVHFDIPDEKLLPEDKSGLPRDANARRRAMERLRRGQGLRILEALRPSYPGKPVIVMTALDDLPTEADPSRLDAEDFTYLLDDEYLDARALKAQVEGILANRSREHDDGPFYWGQTEAMTKLRRRVSILARGQLPMIIMGQTGTGKTLLAREFVHARSKRPGPFVAVDLSTIPTDLMAAHLFGVVKGAYTGATTSREGVLGRANSGTLFLDEIGNLGVDVQKSLLQVLQEGRYRPVGSVDERLVDVKLVVATNEDLAKMVREGRFREDLYMRLNPATAVTLPSLRKRRDDFQSLLGFFMTRVASTGFNRDLVAQYVKQRGLKFELDAATLPVSVGNKLPGRRDDSRLHFLLHPSSFKRLRNYEWPGSFRQFEMVLSNLLTFTLVDLVERVEAVEPSAAGGLASRPDVVPIAARTVSELLQPLGLEGDADGESDGEEENGNARLSVVVRRADSLNQVSCEVEAQYLSSLYRRCQGDLSQLALLLLGDENAGRKVQLRMNQLGLKLRELKKGR
jgi:two-component system nitrogen regulation response regulator GlnG